MTLEHWLQEALGVFPDNVQKALREEYTAHYQDHLDAGGDADAKALFGTPTVSQHRLKKTYLTRAALDQPRTLATPAGAAAVLFSFGLLYLELSYLQGPHVLLRLTVPVVGLLAALGLWLQTRHLPEARQASIRQLGFVILIYAEMLPSIYPSASHTSLVWIIPANILMLLVHLFHTDRRVQRTLHPSVSRRS